MTARIVLCVELADEDGDGIVVKMREDVDDGSDRVAVVERLTTNPPYVSLDDLERFAELLQEFVDRHRIEAEE